jgi:alpha-amylase/alpha-mannosidase (GH57 family)
MKYLCIHGHFYQPPRENPWLEQVELQDSAYPYHDWNERITAECYGPNLAARILDGQQRITRIVNNYSKISYNFGPTLLSWAAEHARDVYRGIIDADKRSLKQFSGHGCALAQAYNHMIMPLANRRDKQTQIRWGVEDFVSRFGRAPEGMWLPETAVDSETLALMAEEGIGYTILAPHQAKAVRPLGGNADWQDVTGGKIDPTRAYLFRTTGGKTIHLFFYDGPISQAVAFEKLLENGEKFATRLLGGLSDGRNEPQLAHIATDGETYGHHHRHGEMALAYALEQIESKKLARVTNYGEFLETVPTMWEAQIYERTAWSCVHGVERWRSNCGCNS